MSTWEFGRTARLTLILTDPSTGAYVNGTGVVVTVTRPDATVVNPAVTNPSTGSYYADAALTQAGTWRARWADGSGQTLDEQVLVVAPAASGTAWAPSLDQVAAHVPLRTIEIGSLTGSPVNTFTGATLPTAQQVDTFITEGVAWVTSVAGALHADLYEWGAAVAALWAAAQVELAQHDQQRDMRRFESLMAQAGQALVPLAARNEALTGVDVESGVTVAYAFPDPVRWGDEVVL